MNVLSDRELVEAVLCGDQNSYAVLVDRYKASVVGVAAQILHDKHAAEDAAQDAFVTAYERLHSLRDAAAFGGWILRIARRVAIHQARRHRHLQWLHVTVGADVAEQNQRIDEQSKELLSLVKLLPEREQLV